MKSEKIVICSDPSPLAPCVRFVSSDDVKFLFVAMTVPMEVIRSALIVIDPSPNSRVGEAMKARKQLLRVTTTL